MHFPSSGGDRGVGLETATFFFIYDLDYWMCPYPFWFWICVFLSCHDFCFWQKSRQNKFSFFLSRGSPKTFGAELFTFNPYRGYVEIQSFNVSGILHHSRQRRTGVDRRSIFDICSAPTELFFSFLLVLQRFRSYGTLFLSSDFTDETDVCRYTKNAAASTSPLSR